MNETMVFAFVSRHEPTPEQRQLALQQGIELDYVGDRDAFTVVREDIQSHGNYEGVCVVHPAAALRLAPFYLVGIFKNGDRPGPDGKPSFKAESLHVYDLRPGDQNFPE